MLIYLYSPQRFFFRMTNQIVNGSSRKSTINTKSLADANQAEDEHKNLVNSFVFI